MPLEPQEELKLAWDLQAKKVAQDYALDPQRLVLQAAVATAAVLTPIVGILGYWIGH